MSVTAQKGILGFGPQDAKESIATTFYRHKAVGIDLSPLDDVRLGTPEIGGASMPTFPYKAGYMGAGGATLFPRLQDTLGWLLYATMGSVATTVGDGTGDLPETGAFQHVFDPASDDSYIPWVTLRKYIPGSATADDVGETYTDAKVISSVVNLVNDGPISMRMDFLAREYAVGDPSGWSWSNTYEDYTSIPVGAVVGGSFKVPTFSADALPIVGASITMANAPLDIQQEKVYGSPKLEDITIIGRQASFDIICKWKDADLYRAILTGSTSGTGWTADPYVNDLEVIAFTPQSMPSLTDKYRLKITAEEVMWRVQGIQLAAGQSVMMRIQGVAIDNATNYLSMIVDNKTSAYSWPTP